jgi:hypothetical protein
MSLDVRLVVLGHPSSWARATGACATGARATGAHATGARAEWAVSLDVFLFGPDLVRHSLLLLGRAPVGAIPNN